MSLKKLLLSKSDSSSSFDPEAGVNGQGQAGSSFRKTRFKSVIIHASKKSVKRPEYRVAKVAKENAVSYEEFLDILQKPNIFIISWSSNTACCNRKQTYHQFEITNVTGNSILKGKQDEKCVRVFDSRNRLFMMLDYKINANGEENPEEETILSVPNSNIPLAKLKQLPSYMPYNKRFQMQSDHFPELNCNIEQQTLPSRYTGALYKYTVTAFGRKVVAKLLKPSTGGQMYVLVDESVSVFQKSGILAVAIFISRKPMKNVGKMVIISIIFFLVFMLGFYIVASTVFDIRYKRESGAKFPNKLKTLEDV